MSAHLAHRIDKPPFFGIKHLVQGRGKRRSYVIGWDSEAHSCYDFTSKRNPPPLLHPICAENGHPFLYQFAHPDGRCDLVSVPFGTEKHETLYAFLRYLWQHTKDRDTEYIVVGYNLGYEFTQLFRDLDDETKLTDRFTIGDKSQKMPSVVVGIEYYMDILNSKRYTFTIEWAKSHQRVKVIDGMAFVQGGLDTAAKLLGIGAKLDKPPRFDRASAFSPEMRAYAMEDALITQRLGEWIIDLHESKDVKTTISAPHFASSVYKRAYLDGEISQATGDLEQAGLSAYHGGKNGFYLPKPMVLKNIWHVDIRSAYPEAMRQLPDPEQSEWLYHDAYSPGVHAIWHITGRYKRCPFRGLMGLDNWPNSGQLEAHVTSYELDEALARDEIVLTSCEGWVMEGPTDTGSLVRYVDDFYALKRYAKTDGEKLYAKLLLNSLYGKFFQKVALGSVGAIELGTGKLITTDPTQDYDYRAGGLYHPPIAALITGYVRAKIHRMEHDFRSVMTSTDGIFCYDAPPKELLGKELGQLSAERGRLQIYRERLYIFDPEKPEHTDECPPGCRDKHPVYAKHGYQGTLEDLRKLELKPGWTPTYYAKRLTTLRQSTGRLAGERHRPGEFVYEERKLRLPGDEGPPIH